METSRGDAAAAAWLVRGDASDATIVTWMVRGDECYGLHGRDRRAPPRYLGLQGDHSHDRREAVNATYELVCQHQGTGVGNDFKMQEGV